MTTFHNILVIRTDRIGDVVLTTPALRALRLTFPAARLTMLVSDMTRALVEGNPDIDEVLVDHGRGKRPGFFSLVRLVFILRRHHFDLAINFHTKKRTNLLCFLAGIPRRIGYATKKWGKLLTDQIPDDRAEGKKHEAQYCLDMIKSLGVKDVPLGPFVPWQREAEEWARKVWEELGLDSAHPIFAVLPGSSCQTKKWPPRLFAELINELKTAYQPQIILVGAPEDRDTAWEIRQNVGAPVIDLTGQTTLSQFVSLIRRCTLLISNDSGPAHIADAAGTPVVSIFVRNQPGINPERWRPLGKHSTFVAPPVDLTVNFAKGKVASGEYLEKVKVEDVRAAVDAVYKLCYNQRSF